MNLPFIPRFVTRLKTIGLALGLNFFRRTHCLAVEYTRGKFNIVHKSNKKRWQRDSNPRQKFLLVFSGQRSNPLRHESYTLKWFAFNSKAFVCLRNCTCTHTHHNTLSIILKFINWPYFIFASNFELETFTRVNLVLTLQSLSISNQIKSVYLIVYNFEFK